MKNNGKKSSRSLFRAMQDWLGRELKAAAKDDMNKVQDFFQVSFDSMVLAFTASTFGFTLTNGQFPPEREFLLV